MSFLLSIFKPVLGPRFGLTIVQEGLLLQTKTTSGPIATPCVLCPSSSEPIMTSSTIRELRMNSLLAFDYATTGSDPVRDRPMEFACVRLDMGLNIIGNPTSLHCKPSPDHLPDPAACLLNGITPQFCEEVGLTELAFVNEVHRQLGTPGNSYPSELESEHSMA